MKLLRGIKTYLRESKELRLLFPHLKRSTRPGDPWNAHAITVEREVRARDPSIQVVGCGGLIIGARVDLLIMDDVLSHRTARTKRQQEKLLAWYQSNIAGRLTEMSRVVAVNTAWARHDLLHHLASLSGWRGFKFGVIDPRTGLPRWPEVWSVARIAQARINLGPIEAARQLDCEPVEEGTSRFPEEALNRATKMGESLFLAKSLIELLRWRAASPRRLLLSRPAWTWARACGRPAPSPSSSPRSTTPDGNVRQLVSIEAGRLTGPGDRRSERGRSPPGSTASVLVGEQRCPALPPPVRGERRALPRAALPNRREQVGPEVGRGEPRRRDGTGPVDHPRARRDGRARLPRCRPCSRRCGPTRPMPIPETGR